MAVRNARCFSWGQEGKCNPGDENVLVLRPACCQKMPCKCILWEEAQELGPASAKKHKLYHWGGTAAAAQLDRLGHGHARLTHQPFIVCKSKRSRTARFLLLWIESTRSAAATAPAWHICIKIWRCTIRFSHHISVTSTQAMVCQHVYSKAGAWLAYHLFSDLPDGCQLYMIRHMQCVKYCLILATLGCVHSNWETWCCKHDQRMAFHTVRMPDKQMHARDTCCGRVS